MKIRVSVSTGYVGSHKQDTLEIPDEDLEGLDEAEREKVLEEAAQEWLWNVIDFGWSEVSE